MALTLSVGFVVDDAIVMLENIVRHMEMGKPPLEAALEGVARDRLHHPVDDAVAGRGVHSRAVHGRASLGRLFHEFAVTISVAILISGFVSLTLTPMLCSRFLRDRRVPRDTAACTRRSRRASTRCAAGLRAQRWRG